MSEYKFDLSDIEGKYHLKYIKNRFDPIPGTQLRREFDYIEAKNKFASKYESDVVNDHDVVTDSSNSDYKLQFAEFQTEKLMNERVGKPMQDIREKFQTAALLIDQDKTRIFDKYSPSIIKTQNVVTKFRPSTTGKTNGTIWPHNRDIHSSQGRPGSSLYNRQSRQQVGFVKKKEHKPDEWNEQLIQHLEKCVHDQNLYEIDKLILKYPSIVYYRSDDAIQHTLLHICVLHGYVRLLEMLLQRGLNPNMRNGTGSYPTHLCVGTWGVALTLARSRRRKPKYFNEIEKSMALIPRPPTATATANTSGKLKDKKNSESQFVFMTDDLDSGFNSSIMTDDSSVILNQPKAQQPYLSEDEIIALMSAMLMVLYQYGALINLQDFNGNTCLHLACRYDLPPKIITIFINFESNVTLCNKIKQMPVDILTNNDKIDSGTWASQGRKVIRNEIRKMIINAEAIVDHTKIDEFARFWRHQNKIKKELKRKQIKDEKRIEDVYLERVKLEKLKLDQELKNEKYMNSNKSKSAKVALVPITTSSSDKSDNILDPNHQPNTTTTTNNNNNSNNNASDNNSVGNNVVTSSTVLPSITNNSTSSDKNNTTHPADHVVIISNHSSLTATIPINVSDPTAVGTTHTPDSSSSSGSTKNESTLPNIIMAAGTPSQLQSRPSTSSFVSTTSHSNNSTGSHSHSHSNNSKSYHSYASYRSDLLAGLNIKAPDIGLRVGCISIGAGLGVTADTNDLDPQREEDDDEYDNYGDEGDGNRLAMIDEEDLMSRLTCDDSFDMNNITTTHNRRDDTYYWPDSDDMNNIGISNVKSKSTAVDMKFNNDSMTSATATAPAFSNETFLKKLSADIKGRRSMKIQSMQGEVRAATASVGHGHLQHQRTSRNQLSEAVYLSSVSRTTRASGAGNNGVYSVAGNLKSNTDNNNNNSSSSSSKETLFAVRPMSQFRSNRPSYCPSEVLDNTVRDTRLVNDFRTFQSYWNYTENNHFLDDKLKERQLKLERKQREQEKQLELNNSFNSRTRKQQEEFKLLMSPSHPAGSSNSSSNNNQDHFPPKPETPAAVPLLLSSSSGTSTQQLRQMQETRDISGISNINNNNSSGPSGVSTAATAVNATSGGQNQMNGTLRSIKIKAGRQLMKHSRSDNSSCNSDQYSVLESPWEVL